MQKVKNAEKKGFLFGAWHLTAQKKKKGYTFLITF